jgi:hypothetical protein
MKKILLLLVTILFVFCISGCGTKSVEDIQGQYTSTKDNLKAGQIKEYFIDILDKDTYFLNAPSMELNFIIKRHNDDLNKDYYELKHVYIDKKTFEIRSNMGAVIGKFNPDNGDVLFNDVNYTYKDKTTPNQAFIKYSPENIFSDLMDANLPKYQDSYDRTPDPVRVRQAAYY